MEKEYLIRDFTEFFDENNNELEGIMQHLIGYITQLKSSIKNNLDSLVVNDNGLQIDRKNEKQFKNVLKYSILIGNKIDTKAFFEKLKMNEGDTKFWEKIESVSQISKSLYEETNFIRNLSNEKFEKVINEIFLNNILAYGECVESEDFNQDQNMVFIKILEFSITAIIEKCFNRIQFIDECRLRFDLGDRKVSILWDIILKHEQQLIPKYLFKRMESISADVRQLSSRVNEISNLIKNNKDNKVD